MASTMLYISRNCLINWASEGISVLSAKNIINVHMALPNTNATIVPNTKRHLVDIALMIDANYRLAYPLAKRLEGIANGNICYEGNN
jgi:hypothetical protein